MIFILRGKPHPASFADCAVFWFIVFLSSAVVWSIINPKPGVQPFFNICNVGILLVILTLWSLDRWQSYDDINLRRYMVGYFAAQVTIVIVFQCIRKSPGGQHASKESDHI
jgi:hypothetical protein